MRKIITAGLLMMTPVLAFAFDSPGDIIGKALLDSTAVITTKLQSVSIKLLFTLVLLQFVITMYGAIKSGEVDATFGKLFGSFTWVFFCLYVMSYGAEFIQGVVNYFLNMASEWAGLGGGSFDAGDVLTIGIESYSKLTVAVIKASTAGAANTILTFILPELTFITALMLFFVSIVIMISCAIIAMKIFMAKIELAIVCAISPLSFAFLGLNALRDQGIAPFKYMISLVYRIVLLAAIVSAMVFVRDNLVSVLGSASSGPVKDVWSPVLAAAFGYVLLAFLALKSDSIASTLASGSSNLSSGDVASAAAAGAAAGAALMTGGAAALATGASGAGKAGQTMGDFLKSMTGGGGSVSNASGGIGRGGGPIGQAPKQTQPAGSPGGAMPNLASKQGGGSGASSSGAADTGMANSVSTATASADPGSNTSSEDIAPGGPANMSPGDAASSAAETSALAAGASPGAAAVAGRAAGNAADRGVPPAQAAKAGQVAQAAITAGASPEAAYAAGNAAAAGRSPADISAAVTGAGGTPAQGAAAAAAAGPIPRTGPTAGSMGSGATAGIGGSGAAPSGTAHSALEQKVDRIADALGGPRKPTVGNRLAELNEHAATIDTAGVSASINAHAD